MKKSINTIGTMILIAIVSLLFAGCNYFNRPLLDYLEEWTNTAQVSKHTFDGTYPATGGLTNLPSGGDRVITYYLINPQNYTLDSSVTFAHDDSLVVNNKTPSDFATVEQDASDKNIIRLTLKDSVGATGILPLDGDGTEITPTITITEPNSGRTFGSYTVPVRVNSLPPRLFNAVIMKYRDSNEKYAVCFNLPAMGAGDIHRDITQITVNGTFNGQPFNNTYQVTGGGTGTVTVDGVPESSSSDYRVIGSEFVDMGTTFVGIKTGLDLGPTTPTCTITLTDSSGASTVTTVSTVSTLLNKIYVNENSGDDNNTGTVSSPVKTIGNALEKLRDVPKGNVILQSDISLTGEVTVGSGISATVTTDGSGRTVTNGAGRVFNITSGGSLIVGENITLTGTNAGGSGGAVYVDGGSFTMESGSKITGSSADYGGGVYIASGTFNMNDTATIQDNRATTHGGGVYVDGTFSVSGSPTITGNTVSNNANNVYLPGGKTITIGDSGLTGGTIGVTAEAITPGDAVRITDTDVTGAANKFTSDISPYSVEETITTTDGRTAVFLSDAEVAYKTSSSAQGNTLGSFAKAYGGKVTEITLLKDITCTPASEFSWPIVFDWTCTLDLNGYAIDRNLTSETNEGQVIKIFSPGNLTIKDSSVNVDGTGGTGKITGGYNDGDQDDGGGGIYAEGGSLTLESGSITGNKTFKNGGGVYVGSGCTFTMKGGSITDNTTENNSGISIGSYGGGVYVDSNGTFTMNSGTISGNKVVGTRNNHLGGGVYVDSNGTFTMNSGTIGGTGNDVNTALKGGGVFVNGGTFIMSGDAAIKGNSATESGGGVFVNGGEFSMNGGTIGGTGNVTNTAGYGGGVGMSGGTFNMSGDASISGNEATVPGYGGGVYLGTGTFTMSGDAAIKANSAVSGGGVYVDNGDGTFDPQGGTVSDNKPDNVYLKP